MFSIIIPCQKFNPYLEECLEHILNQDYADFEIIVLPDVSYRHPRPQSQSRAGSSGDPEKKYDSGFPIRACPALDAGSGMIKEKIKIIPTGSVLPGKKRNIGVREAQGEILVFIDDDAYPAHDWLKTALKYFEDENIMAIGGPGLTPPNDSFWQQVSGAMYLSWFSGGNPEKFWPIYKRNKPITDYKLQITNYEITDWPSMNFFVRKKEFLAVGGFDEKYWPGEDTALCHNLVKAGKKIIYAPDVLVYHHRRKNLFKHLKQVGNHKRGLFARIYPKNSLKLKYFLPPAFTVFVLFGWLLLFLPQPLSLIYPGLWILYFSALIISLIQIYVKIKKIKVALATLIYIPLTHFWYGVNFLKGLFLKP